MIDYKTRITFIERSYTKCGGETSPRSFSEKIRLSISLINRLKSYAVCFCCMPSWRLLKYIDIKMQTTCLYLVLIILFLKKRGLELLSLLYFLHDFWREIFLLIYSINWPSFNFQLPLLCEILGNMCIVCVMNFEIYLFFLFKSFYHCEQKVITNNLMSWKPKELLRWNKKHFLSFSKSFQWSKEYKIALQGESLSLSYFL